jgi:hypothetical protein
MPESNVEFGQAVNAVLQWMDTTPETAAAALGINDRTLQAMCQGIVPMRSLVIRFAEGVTRRCEQAEGSPSWWSDVDAWLKLAGYPPRRDAGEPGSPTCSAPPAAPRSGTWREAPPPARSAPLPHAAPAAPAPVDDTPASEFYHPTYERQPWGDTFVHVFWILDQENRRVFQINLPANVDYKARAGQVKQDLASMSRTNFERKYGRFRVQSR